MTPSLSLLLHFQDIYVTLNVCIYSWLFLGHPPYQMLEMLMAMFIECPANMIPGILLVCPDTFELFNTNGETLQFTKTGFTAIAHPSPIEIGTTHGVFDVVKTTDSMVRSVMMQCYLIQLVCYCHHHHSIAINVIVINNKTTNAIIITTTM